MRAPLSLPSPGCARALAAAWLWALAAPPALAQTWPALFEQAWAQHEPVAAARQAQAQVRRDAASRWLAEPPALTLATRSDGLNERRGQREFEAELALPLNTPGRRDGERRAAEAGGRADTALRQAERWRLAGELREAAWALHLARAEADAAARQQREADALREDTVRRVAAGELAPLDLNAATSAAARAAAAALRARQGLVGAEAAFAALAPAAALPAAPELEPPAAAEADVWPVHPLLAALREQLAAARARVDQAEASRRGTPELALGLSREREGAGQPWQARARLALRVPLGAGVQGELPVREAALGLAEAELELLRRERELRAQLEAARAARAQAQALQTLAAQRRELAAQALQWTRQAHTAGQFDLPTLLRAQAESAEAEAEAERARLEAARALSRWNQSLGLIP